MGSHADGLTRQASSRSVLCLTGVPHCKGPPGIGHVSWVEVKTGWGRRAVSSWPQKLLLLLLSGAIVPRVTLMHMNRL